MRTIHNGSALLEFPARARFGILKEKKEKKRACDEKVVTVALNEITRGFYRLSLNSLEVRSRACHSRISAFAIDCRPSRGIPCAAFETR